MSTWMNIDEAAEAAGVTVGTIMWLITQGRIQQRVTAFSHATGGGDRQVVIEELEAVPDLAALNRQREGG